MCFQVKLQMQLQISQLAHRAVGLVSGSRTPFIYQITDYDHQHMPVWELLVKPLCLHHQKDVFQLKDIEKIAPKTKGISK